MKQAKKNKNIFGFQDLEIIQKKELVMAIMSNKWLQFFNQKKNKLNG